MSKFTQSQRASILAEARANIAKRTSSSPRQSEELVYKTHVNAAPSAHASSERSTAVASESENWWQWVDRRIEACLEAHGEEIGTAIGDFCGPQFAALKRQIQLLEREVTQLREQVGLARELAGLRADVAQARAEVPKLPAIAARLEAGQERLRRDVETTKDKLTRVRVRQYESDYKLSELRKQTEQRAASVEMKFETTVSSFRLHEVHPDAARAMKNFAADALKSNWPAYSEKIWIFDPNVKVHGPSNETA